MDSLSSIRSQTTKFCLVLMFLFYHLPYVLSQQQELFDYCKTPFQCGNITVGYPFSGANRDESCGLPSLKLNCNKLTNTTSLKISDQIYNVLHVEMNDSITLLISRQDLSGPFCSASFSSIYLPLFRTLPSYKSLTVFYACDTRRHFLGNFTCPVRGLGSVVQNMTYHELCESFNVIVPTSLVPEEEVLNLTNLETALRNGFEVELNMEEIPCPECIFSDESCFTIAENICCKHISRSQINCEAAKPNFLRFAPSICWKLLEIIGIRFILGGLVMVIIFAFLFWKRRKA